MKRKLIITSFLIVLTQCLIAGIVITTTVTVGRKSQNCAGFGVCSASSTSSHTMGAINGTLQLMEEEGKMILGLSKTDILLVQPEKIIYFDSTSTVIFAEDVVMSSEINTATKSSKPLIIKKGEYPLTLIKGMYYIEIPF